MPALSNNESCFGYNHSWDIVPEDLTPAGLRAVLNVPDKDDVLVVWDAALLVTQELEGAVGKECNLWTLLLFADEAGILCSLANFSGFSVPKGTVVGGQGAAFYTEGAYRPFRSTVDQIDTLIFTVAGSLVVDVESTDFAFGEDSYGLDGTLAAVTLGGKGLKTGDAVTIALTSDEEGDALPSGLDADTTYYLLLGDDGNNNPLFLFYADAALTEPSIEVEDAGQGTFRITRAQAQPLYNGRIKVLARISEPLKYS
jgi:hypothetical protein